MVTHWRIAIVSLALLLVVGTLAPTSSSATEPPTDTGLDVLSEPTGIRVMWRSAALPGTTARQLPDLPLQQFNGLELPGSLLGLYVPDNVPIQLQIDKLVTVPWHGAAPQRALPRMHAWTEHIRNPAEVVSPALPSQPLFILREGRLRGQRLLVVAFSALFVGADGPQVVVELQATIPQGRLVTATSVHNATSAPFTTTEQLLLQQAPAPSDIPNQSLARLEVSAKGMQQISGAALAAIGVDLTQLNPDRLQLWHKNTPIPLEVVSVTPNLQQNDLLRFYVSEIGDRWNSTSTYWLTLVDQAGSRIPQQTPTATAAPRRFARERGVWRNNRHYDPTTPGPDSDHWFAIDMRLGVDESQTLPPLTAAITPTLQRRAGLVRLQLHGSTYTEGLHTLRVAIGSSYKTITWDGRGDWQQALELNVSAADIGQPISVTLPEGATPSGLLIDWLDWDYPVSLNAGGQGVQFTGEPGTWRYIVELPPTNGLLYDITDPANPQRLLVDDDIELAFDNHSTSQRYLVAGPGTLHTPQILASQPHTLKQPLDAEVLYIAPAAFQTALTPLIEYRRSQGYIVAFVAVEEIYQAWSDGQINPTAIRHFLQYAATTWSIPPLAVTLVGDGTSDPRNYTGRTAITHIPPYLAMVDPWLGETACDTCYAQLDGADPTADLLPDLLIGRLPVKTNTELVSLVRKLIDYEQQTDQQAWRSRVLYLADNDYEANGSADPAGSFSAFVAAGQAMQPPGVGSSGIAYAPRPAQLPVLQQEADATQARNQAFAALDRGAGAVVFVGHSHYWQWALTDLQIEKSYLVGLFDADRLSNEARLPVVLAMTCLSSAFQQPAFSGTTIDERLLLQPTTGAVAVWGATGLGVLSGHAALQRGFFERLWSGATPGTAPVGELTRAGYLELFLQSDCCQDAIQTFVLLGDPLTITTIRPVGPIYVPLGGHNTLGARSS